MRAARSISSTNNLSSSLINYNLGFESMAFFLTTIVATLFFFGRSIGVSVTSTTTIFHFFGAWM